MSQGCSCAHGMVSPHPTGDPRGVLPQDLGKGHARGKGGQPSAGGVSLGRPSWADPEPLHVPPQPHGARGHRHRWGARPPQPPGRSRTATGSGRTAGSGGDQVPTCGSSKPTSVGLDLGLYWGLLGLFPASPRGLLVPWRGEEGVCIDCC